MPRKTAREIDWFDMPEPDYRASRLLKALGSPKAFALVKLLARHDVLNVEEMASQLHRTPSDVSKMLKPLRDLDVVRFQKDGRYTLYTLKDRKSMETLLHDAEEYTRKSSAAR
jgi:DNA-binding transcriptional ArsR family regulator